MHDALEFLIRPLASALLWVARGLLWLGWDFGVETVGWTIGWQTCRLVSGGRYPPERLGGQEEAPAVRAFLIEFIGLGCLALLVWALAHYLSA